MGAEGAGAGCRTQKAETMAVVTLVVRRVVRMGRSGRRSGKQPPCEAENPGNRPIRPRRVHDRRHARSRSARMVQLHSPRGLLVRLYSLLALAACTPIAASDGATKDGTANDSSGATGDSSDSGGDSATCAEASKSSCGDPASVIGVVVRAGSEGVTTGDLVVYMTHVDLGQTNQGGYYHTSIALPGVDLSDGPIVTEVDMCEGGEMWSADYGDYNLLAILDQDGSNQPDGFSSDRTPDADEPSARVSPVAMVPGAPSQCFDQVVLDCLDGRSCTAY